MKCLSYIEEARCLKVNLPKHYDEVNIFVQIPKVMTVCGVLSVIIRERDLVPRLEWVFLPVSHSGLPDCWP